MFLAPMVWNRAGMKAFVFFALFMLAPCLHAQPSVTMARVVSNWPTIELYFTVRCMDQPVMFTDKSYFKVFEDGKEKQFTLWCPDPLARCMSSTVLLFDVSASMNGQGISDAIMAGVEYSTLMMQVADEASVMTFNQNATMLQPLTGDSALVYKAVSTMTGGSGARALWDGVYAGLAEVMQGVNACRSVIVLTSGADEGSTVTMSDVIARANRNRIRVHVVGYGPAVDSVALKGFIRWTGGEYHGASSAADLVSIYRALYQLNARSMGDECLVTYQASIEDGTSRQVVLAVNGFCTGSGADTSVYKAPIPTAIERPAAAAAAWSIEIFPNPATASASLFFRGSTPECVHLMVMDADGRLVQDLGARLDQTSGPLLLSLADRAAGVYYVVGTTSTSMQSWRLVKL